MHHGIFMVSVCHYEIRWKKLFLFCRKEEVVIWIPNWKLPHKSRSAWQKAQRIEKDLLRHFLWGWAWVGDDDDPWSSKFGSENFKNDFYKDNEEMNLKSIFFSENWKKKKNWFRFLCLTSRTPSCIMRVAMGAWPWPRDKAWKREETIPFASASWSNELVGSYKWGGGDKRGGHEKFKTLRSDGCYVEQKKKKAENQIINRQL